MLCKNQKKIKELKLKNLISDNNDSIIFDMIAYKKLFNNITGKFPAPWGA
jgi:hypothetical protein